MIKHILLGALLAAMPTTIHAGQAQGGEIIQTEGGPEGAETVPAIVSKKPATPNGSAWKPTGAYAGAKARKPATITVDYDRDGKADTAALVRDGRHTAVIVTSGRTGARRFAWLIDDKVGYDTRLERSGAHTITIVFPESTMIDLFDRSGRPMATYQNG